MPGGHTDSNYYSRETRGPSHSNYNGGRVDNGREYPRRYNNMSYATPSTHYSEEFNTNNRANRNNSSHHSRYQHGRGTYSSEHPSTMNRYHHSKHNTYSNEHSYSNSEYAPNSSYRKPMYSEPQQRRHSSCHRHRDRSRDMYESNEEDCIEITAEHNEENDPNILHTPLPASKIKGTGSAVKPTHIKFETPATVGPLPTSSPSTFSIPPQPINFNAPPSTTVLANPNARTATPPFHQCSPAPPGSVHSCHSQNPVSFATHCPMPVTFNVPPPQPLPPPPPVDLESSVQDSVSILNIFIQKKGLPPPKFTYKEVQDVPPKFLATVSSGAYTITPPYPSKSKKEARKFAAELWMNAYKALESTVHPRQPILYLSEPASPAPPGPSKALKVADESNPKEGWLNVLNFWIQKNQLQFPEIRILQVRGMYYARIKTNYLDVEDPMRHKNRKQARESIAKLAYEQLIQKYPAGSKVPNKPKNTQLPASSLNAAPFYGNKWNECNHIAPSFENAMDVDHDRIKHMEENPDLMAHPPSSVSETILQSMSTTDLMREFCRRGGVNLQVHRASVSDPTIYEVQLGPFIEIHSEIESAFRALLVQIVDNITENTRVQTNDIEVDES